TNEKVIGLSNKAKTKLDKGKYADATERANLESVAKAAKKPAQDLEADVDKLVKAADDARDAQKAVAKARNDMQPLIQSAQTLKKDAADKLAPIQKSFNQLEKDLEQKVRDVTNKNEDIIEVQKELKSLERTVEDRKKSLDLRKEKIPDAISKLEEAKSKLPDAKKLAVDLASDLEKKKVEFEGLQQKLSQAEQQIKSLESELGAKPLDQLEQEFAKAQQAAKSLETLLAGPKQEASDAEKALRTLQDKIAQAAEQKLPALSKCPESDPLKKELDELTKKAEEANKKVKFLEGLGQKRQTEVQQALNKLDEAKQKAADLQKLKSELPNLSTPARVANEGLKAAQEKEKEAKKAYDQAQAMVSSAENALRTAEKGVADMEKNISSGLQSIQEVNDKKKVLEGELANLETAASDAKKLLANEETKLNKAADELTKATKELKRLEDVDKAAKDAEAKAKETADQAFSSAAHVMQFLDDAHDIKRHGPELSDKALKDRIQTGMAPDGKFSPTKESSRFSSYEELVKTKIAGKNEAARLNGVDVSKAPTGPPFSISSGEFQHKTGTPPAPKAIGSGFVGTGPASPVSHKAKVGNGWAAQTAVAPPTKTKTQVEWDPYQERWKTPQHHPAN
ncbi:MAG TPA: hypothetical protein VE621_13720, partial [Bryobacteraceae bacterium]|nr:hypothetical protein [Bryobacteraceae bacterium]